MILLREKGGQWKNAKRLDQSLPLGKAQPGVGHYSAFKLRKPTRLAEAIVALILEATRLRSEAELIAPGHLPNGRKAMENAGETLTAP